MAENDSTGANGAAGGEQAQQQLAIHKVYLKDASLESPASPDVFRSSWQPEANVDLNARSHKIDEEGTYEVVLTVTVTAKSGEKTAYLCEVQQAGIFAIRGIEGATLGGVLGSYCPGMLFPYAREAISDLTSKAGFPPMVLAPVNFDAIYAQRLAEQQKQQQEQPAGEQG